MGWGGGASGPRYLAAVMPALALLIVPVVDRIWQAPIWARAATIGLVGLSAITQIVNSLFDFYQADVPMYAGLWAITPPPALWVPSSILTDSSQLIYRRMWQIVAGRYWDVLWLARGSVDWLLLVSLIALITLAGAFLALLARHPEQRRLRWGAAVQPLLTLAVISLMLYRYPYSEGFGYGAGQPTPGLDQAVDIIKHDAGPTDTVITLLPTRWPEWLNRYPGRVADVGLTFEAPLRPETETMLEDIKERSAQVWLVTEPVASGDPQNGVEQWLAARSFGGSTEVFDPFRVMVYSLYPPVDALEPSSVVFGDGQFELAGHGLNAARTASGWSINVWLRWKAIRKGDIPYTVFVHVRDASGAVLGQHDGPPQAGFAPTPGWETGQTIDDRHHVVLPLDTPPGEYAVVVGLYDANTGARLTIGGDGQDAFEVGTMTVGSGE